MGADDRGRMESTDADGAVVMPPTNADGTEGQGFRWSWDEVKSYFFGYRSSPESQGKTTSSSSLASALSWLGTRSSLSGLFKKRNREEADLPSDREDSYSRSYASALGPDEAVSRQGDRVAAMREKKKLRERERRTQINSLYDSLGDLVGYKNTKNKAKLLEHTLNILNESEDADDASKTSSAHAQVSD